jgi:hypothetical protein
MLLRVRFLHGLVPAAVLSVGCGATAVFVEDGEGAGGAGGSGGSTTSSKATTGVMTSGMPSAATGPISPCQAFCQAHGECFGPECLGICDSFYVPGCEVEAEQLVVCLTEWIQPGCQLGRECDFAVSAYNQCVEGGRCENYGCEDGGPGSCVCAGQCFGVPFTEACYYVPEGVQCDCYRDIGFVATCFQDELYCDVSLGCCKYYVLMPD